MQTPRLLAPTRGPRAGLDACLHRLMTFMYRLQCGVGILSEVSAVPHAHGRPGELPVLNLTHHPSRRAPGQVCDLDRAVDDTERVLDDNAVALAASG